MARASRSKRRQARVSRQVGGQDLDRDAAVQARVERSVHLTHAACRRSSQRPRKARGACPAASGAAARPRWRARGTRLAVERPASSDSTSRRSVRVAAARRVQEGRAFARSSFVSASRQQRLDHGFPALGASCLAPLPTACRSAWSRRSFAIFQSRNTVSGDTSSAAAVSSTVSPPRYGARPPWLVAVPSSPAR